MIISNLDQRLEEKSQKLTIIFVTVDSERNRHGRRPLAIAPHSGPAPSALRGTEPGSPAGWLRRNRI